ncbi:GAS2-like protein 2 [Elgaria multicarinata webbii]|uniref:GAS2-like protein 2 n=1 Tax=Elgaria multicarinata webbii TaxID=159646 RepID=UPI002FCD0BB6
MSGIQEASMRSIRPFKTSELYLYAMKEDLAEWLKELYELDVDVASFLEVLETGTLLCHHANSITQVARDLSQDYPGLAKKLQLPMYGVTCNDFAQPGTFQARDNVSNFIQWCRKEMDIKEVVMFETEDLVLRKNEKNFVLCLLEVARRASRFGMSAPTLIQMEEEIEYEIREDLNLPREETPLPKQQRKPTDFKNLDQIVQHLVSRCTCPVQFSMIKVSEGKYRVGDSSTLIFIRILRNHVMVRVGGGWDTLEHYLDKHDPCRCTSLSHKQALKMASPQRSQAAQVQHEITARLTPRADKTNKPQPALIVSRCQSPLLPVEWRTYTPRGLGTGRKGLSPVPPDNSGSRKTACLPISQDQSDPRRGTSVRVRERSATPSRRLPAAEERPGSKPAVSTQSGRETFRISVSSESDGNAEGNCWGSKSLPGPRHGRTADRIQGMPPSLKSKAERPTPSGTAARRDGVPQPPESLQRDVKGCPKTRPSSPVKAFRVSYQQAAKAPTESPKGPQEVVTVGGGREDVVMQRSPSPVKLPCQIRKADSGTKTPGRVGSPFYRPLTPTRNYQESLSFRNGGITLDKDRTPFQSKVVLKDRVDHEKEWSKTVNEEASTGRVLDRSRVGARQFGTKEYRAFFGQVRSPGSPCKHSQRSPGDTKELVVEKERVYTPLPINLAEEQALYQSLEEEILANIKELESDSDDTYPLGGYRMGGVPRSGVYMPERETRWQPGGLHYDNVIQELSMTLQRAHGGTEGCQPRLSSSLVNGNQVENKVLEQEATHQEETPVASEMARDEPSGTTHGEPAEVNVNGDTSQATPSEASDPSESSTLLENARAAPSKPKRSLKKPERVPSIYKLKLRPKIRPRRDNRPEKRPSKIPKPVTHKHAQRTSSVKGQGKTQNANSSIKSSLGSMKQKNRGKSGSEGQTVVSECSPSSVQDGEKTDGKTGSSDGEETWV